MVGRAYKTTRDDVARCRALLERRERQNIGSVINGLREADASYDYYSPTTEQVVKPRVAGPA